MNKPNGGSSAHCTTTVDSCYLSLVGFLLHPHSHERPTVNSLPIGLVFVSTFLHAGWNLLARAERREHTFFLRSLSVIVAVGLVPAALAMLRLPPLTAGAVLCALISGCFCGVYYFGLARAYNAGDFTVVYPIARALPVILVGLGDVARGRVLTPAGWLGMSLVAGACMFIPLQSVRQFSLQLYFNRTTMWAVLTALATVGYTLVDKFAAEAVHNSPSFAALYGYMFFCSSAAVYVVCLSLFGRPPEDAEQVGWQRPVLAGVFNYAAYWLVLWAYQLAQQAGYVVAFRQFSIVVGVAIAAVWFHEKGAVIRLIAACVMVIGLALIGLYG